MSLDYDALVALSGDGLPHEVLNGFASRPDAAKAIRTPIVPVPTGSANAFSVNLLGVEPGFDVGMSALNIIKGKPMALDLCSVTQGETRSWSFMALSAGLMADIDLGTESMRWMGDTRFLVGYLRGIFQNRPCPISLSVKVVSSDKQKLADEGQKLVLDTKANTIAASELGLSIPPPLDLPSDLYASEPIGHGGWMTFDKPFLYLYGGLQPYVSRDLLQFPVAQPSDGLLDLVVQEVVGRGALLAALDGAERGKHFWLESQHYYKALAYRIQPLETTDEKGLLSIDGEAYPLDTTYVEVHQGIGRTLSIHGHYINPFSGK